MPRWTCILEEQILARRGVAETWPEVSEKTHIVQHFVSVLADSALGTPKKWLLLASLWEQLSQLLTHHQLWEWRACPAPSITLSFRFAFPHGEGGLSVIHKTIKTTDSLSHLQQKAAQNY